MKIQDAVVFLGLATIIILSIFVFLFYTSDSSKALEQSNEELIQSLKDVGTSQSELLAEYRRYGFVMEKNIEELKRLRESNFIEHKRRIAFIDSLHKNLR